MKIDATIKVHPNYGKYRTIKVFALFPRFLYYADKRYFIWLEYFYQDQHYTHDGWSSTDGWRIESDYPILPGIKPRYTKTPMFK